MWVACSQGKRKLRRSDHISMIPRRLAKKRLGEERETGPGREGGEKGECYSRKVSDERLAIQYTLALLSCGAGRRKVRSLGGSYPTLQWVPTVCLF